MNAESNKSLRFRLLTRRLVIVLCGVVAIFRAFDDRAEFMAHGEIGSKPGSAFISSLCAISRTAPIQST